MSSQKRIKKKVKSKKSTLHPLLEKGWLIVFAVSCILYLNTIGHGFTQDDAIVISDNMLTQRGFGGIKELLTKDTFYGFFKVEGKSRLVAGGRYRPLTPVMFAIEYQFFGLRPWIGHLMNVLLFGVTGIVIYLLMFRLGKDAKLGKNASWFALIVGLLFAVHPIHTEVVANIKGRDEIMSMLLALVALWMIYREKGGLNVAKSIGAGLVFLMALLSKENAITFLAITPLALYFFKKATIRTALLSTLPLLAATAIFLWIRGLVIGWEFGEPPRELLNNPFIKIEDGRYIDFTFGERTATITYTLGKYVQLLFFPHPLTHDYYPRHVGIMRWTDWQVLLSAFMYVSMIVLFFKGFKHRSIWAFGIAFFLCTLSIVSNVVFPVGTNMSERFAYMPSLGWAMAVVSAGLLATGGNPKRRQIAAGVLAVVLVAFAGKTVHRNMAWKSNYTLFTTDVNTSGNSAKLLAACGGELITRAFKMEEGPAKEAQIREGIGYVQRAQEVHPNYKMSYLLKGNAHYHLKEWEAAIASYDMALRLDSGYGEARKNLGVVYRDAGRYYGQEAGDLTRSVEYLTSAVELLPTDYETVHALGVAYGLSGQSSKAVEMFSRGVELAPDNAMAHFNLGLAYQRTGDQANAQKHREIAVQLDPDILNNR